MPHFPDRRVVRRPIGAAR